MTATCLRCPSPAHPRMTICMDCAVNALPDDFERASAELKTWLEAAWPMLAWLPDDDPRKAPALARWEARHRTWEQLEVLLMRREPVRA